jgi:co-chaperonin GroES (HSP10)
MSKETKTFPALYADDRKPGKGRLIVQVLDDQERSTASGLFIPSTNNELLRAKIIGVGECAEKHDLNNIVNLMKGSGMDIGLSEMVIHENEILYTEIISEVT